MSCHSVVDEWVSVVRLRVWGVIRWLFYKLSSVIWDYGLSFNGWWMSLLSGIERLRYHSMVVLQVVIRYLGLRVVIQWLMNEFAEWDWTVEGSFDGCSTSCHQWSGITGCHSIVEGCVYGVRLRVWGVILLLFYKLVSEIWGYGLSFMVLVIHVMFDPDRLKFFQCCWCNCSV